MVEQQANVVERLHELIGQHAAIVLSFRHDDAALDGVAEQLGYGLAHELEKAQQSWRRIFG